MEPIYDCSICSEVFNNPYSTKCGHTFCKSCIDAWITRSADCPTCRAPVTKTFPNIFARQAIEARAKEVEQAAKPVVAAVEVTPPAKPIGPPSPIPPAVVAVEPVGIAATIFDSRTNQIVSFRMPQMKDVGRY